MTANTIDEVITKLDDIIEISKKEEDPLGYFAALYQNVTITVKEKLHTGYFDNDERMEKLDVIFANRYLEAYSKLKQNKPITQSWRKAFVSANDWNLIVLQHLLLGMNAHISLDLGIAAAEMSNENSIDALKSDFDKINDILSSLIDEVQADLASIWPTLFWILKKLKKVDDFIINFSMQLARDDAWKFAKSLVGIDHTKKDDLINKRDIHVKKLSDKITSNSLFIRLIFKIIRIGERGKPSNKIMALERR
ncbi:MAG: DUF5995 family protein [Bacteroidota bacterium]